MRLVILILAVRALGVVVAGALLEFFEGLDELGRDGASVRLRHHEARHAGRVGRSAQQPVDHLDTCGPFDLAGHRRRAEDVEPMALERHVYRLVVRLRLALTVRIAEDNRLGGRAWVVRRGEVLERVLVLQLLAQELRVLALCCLFRLQLADDHPRRDVAEHDQAENLRRVVDTARVVAAHQRESCAAANIRLIVGKHAGGDVGGDSRKRHQVPRAVPAVVDGELARHVLRQHEPAIVVRRCDALQRRPVLGEYEGRAGARHRVRRPVTGRLERVLQSAPVRFVFGGRGREALGLAADPAAQPRRDVDEFVGLILELVAEPPRPVEALDARALRFRLTMRRQRAQQRAVAHLDNTRRLKVPMPAHEQLADFFEHDLDARVGRRRDAALASLSDVLEPPQVRPHDASGRLAGAHAAQRESAGTGCAVQDDGLLILAAVPVTAGAELALGHQPRRARLRVDPAAEGVRAKNTKRRLARQQLVVAGRDDVQPDMRVDVAIDGVYLVRQVALHLPAAVGADGQQERNQQRDRGCKLHRPSSRQRMQIWSGVRREPTTCA